LQAFWESCSFTFVGHVKGPSGQRMHKIASTADGVNFSTQIVDLWLDIDIARLKVLPRHHIRSMTIDTGGLFHVSKLEIPECLFGTSLRRLTFIVNLETRTRCMEVVVGHAREMLVDLKERQRSLTVHGIVLVPALRIDTHAKEGPKGEPGEQRVGTEEEEPRDDDGNDDSSCMMSADGEPGKVPKERPIKTEVVEFDGWCEVPETDWEGFVLERLTVVGVVVRDEQK
jgi:hypothetical protein